jgi:TorA maturation chaperone TorD
VNKVSRHKPETTSEELEVAIGRAAIYGFLARSLLFPTEGIRESVHAELIPLLRGMSLASVELEALLASGIEVQVVDLQELRRAHGRVFTHIENQDCPAHESAYCPGDVFRRADVMADVAAFYKAHGLSAGGDRQERVDHITTELEFLSFLARKQAYALENLGPDEVEECERSQKHFLRDHVGCWVPGFADRLQVVADHPFFMAIGALMETWIEADLDWLGVEAQSRLTEPQPLPPPGDDGCGADVDGFTNTPVEIRS